MTTIISETYNWQETSHLRVGFYPPSDLLIQNGDSLPYHQLGGLGLERLCYLLLLDQGKVPRYFGNSGQKQYGIDLLVTHGDDTIVYQCKNKASFPPYQMKAALKTLETEWLACQKLPKPTEFVLCCPLSLQERKQNEAWTELERKFRSRTGVQATFWDRNYLDERLRRLPDVVADLFSNRAVEQFCNLRDWNGDLFRPLVSGCGERTVDRYLEQKEAGRFYVSSKLQKIFTQKLDVSGSLLIRGLPGSGKTMTGLTFAESLRNRQNPYRIFYINLQHDLTEDALVQGIGRRLTQPTIFFLDDCYGKYELLDRVQTRLSPILAERPGKGLLIFTARTIPTSDGMPRGDDSYFEKSLAENHSVMKFEPTPSLFRKIITLIKPHFTGLSKEKLHKVFEFTGHDLFLLDKLLQTLDSLEEIDQIHPQRLFEATLSRYFGSSTVHRPGFMKLAALAQFDLAPPLAYFDVRLDREDEKAATQLLVVANRPPCYHFLHSSAAELIFRALAWNDRADDYLAKAANYLAAFFNNRSAKDKQLADDLSKAILNHLSLENDQEAETFLKSRLLADDGIQAVIEDVFKQLPLNLLAFCLIVLYRADQTTYERYHNLVQQKVNDGSVLRKVIKQPFWESGLFLVLVKRSYPVWLSNLRSQLLGYGFPLLIEKIEFQSFLVLLTNLSEPCDSSWSKCLDSVPNTKFEDMIELTIASGRSIGTVNLSLRELKGTDPALLALLERKIGAQGYLRLITSLGGIPELFRIIQRSSASMAKELIEALDSAIVDALIAKTIAFGRSIGTINLPLRQLKGTDPALLTSLERKIGAQGYLRLITSLGGIPELFSVIRISSASMAKELIEALDSAIVDALIDQTISSGRSIGTMELALRELKQTAPALLQKLAGKIGAKRWWQIICSNGTINILAGILRGLHGTFSQELVDASDKLSLYDWQSLLLRDNFQHLCNFVRWKAHLFHTQFTPSFLNSLKPTFKTLIRRETWVTLRRGEKLLRSSPESSVKQHLLTLLQDHIVATVKQTPSRFDSFDEAAAFVSLLLNQLPSHRLWLIDSLALILPEQDEWHTSKGFLRCVRPLFFILSDPQAHSKDAYRVLRIGNDRAVAPLFLNATALDLFLYLWNLYGLWLQLEREESTFADFLHPAIQNALTTTMSERFHTKTNQEECDNLVALAGFVSFHKLSFDSAEKVYWASTLPSFQKLLPHSSSKTFVPVVFFLLGLEWLFDRKNCISPETWIYVLSKMNTCGYSEKRAAIEHLYYFVHARVHGNANAH